MATTTKTTSGTPGDTKPTGGDRVAELEAENARLREALAASGQPAVPGKPTEPSFGLSEGQRDELERTGRTVSPFTGARQVGSGEPGEKPREVDAATFAKAGNPAGRK